MKTFWVSMISLLNAGYVTVWTFSNNSFLAYFIYFGLAIVSLILILMTSTDEDNNKNMKYLTMLCISLLPLIYIVGKKLLKINNN